MRLFEGDINRRPLTEHDGSGVSALLELDGFVVRGQLLDEDTGDWWLAVERVQGRGWCPSCGVRVGQAVAGSRSATAFDVLAAAVQQPDTGAVADHLAGDADPGRPRPDDADVHLDLLITGQFP